MTTKDILVDRDKFDALLHKIAHSKPASLGQIKSIMASARASRTKKQPPKDAKKD